MQQRRVIRLAACDKTTTQIAAELRISPHTVRNHLKALYRRLGVNGRAGAVRRCCELGIICFE